MATSVIKPAFPWVDEPLIVPVQEELVKAAVLQDTHASVPGNTRVFSVEIQRNLVSSKRTTDGGDQYDGNEINSKIKDFSFKVVTHLTSTTTTTDERSGERECHYASTAEEALQIYEELYKEHASSSGDDVDGNAPMHPVSSVANSIWIGSEALRKTLLYRETYSPTQELSPEVAILVENVWKEAMGKLKDTLAVPVSSILPGQVAKAEAILYQIWNILCERRKQDGKDVDYKYEVSDAEIDHHENDFYDLIPHKDEMRSKLMTRGRVSTKLDLCQMIRDAVYIREETGWQKRPTTEAKYRALRCFIQHLPSDHPEYEKIRSLVLSTLSEETDVSRIRIFSVSRPPDEEGYLHEIGNDTLLFHATKPNNVLGILSRGLLMPKVVVEMFDGQRRDEGLLGPGLYFGDRTSTCIQYTRSGFFSKTRMMFVFKVALGSVQDFYEFDTKMHQAPEGFQSTHGVRATEIKPSEFKEDEFVVYSTKQQCVRYLVEFSIEGDEDLGYDDYQDTDDDDDGGNSDDEAHEKIDLLDVQACEDPVSRTATGLVVDNSREGVTLEEVHVRGHITDLAAETTILQVYQSQITESNIREARYVFPLDEKAAVCGFEAYINDKHVIGTVKAKEKAIEEYREAVRKGHGAYLMQEEASNVFSVSIGNLPPLARVVIKITYVTELGEEEGGKMAFNLLGSVAPWIREEIHGTQLTEETGALTGIAANEKRRKESLQLTMEMSSCISSIESPTHAIKVKRESKKATVTLGDGVQLGDGFQLLISVNDPKTPRIWTEFDPSHNSYASMAVFYPNIHSELTLDPEVILLLDCSTSMKGEPKHDGKKICKMILQMLPKKSRFNVITFGTDFTELFPTVEPVGIRQLAKAVTFVESATSVGGSSEAWRPLRSLSLLPLKNTTRNVFLVSDGHLTNEKLTLDIASQYKSVNRIFTFAVSSTENRHTLRALADLSGGACEVFSPKAKSKWEGKVTAQIERSRQPSVSCVDAVWQTEGQTENIESQPKDLIQVPAQTSSVFSGSKVLLFSLGPKVKQVQLSAEISGQSIVETLNAPTEFEGASKTLHRLAVRALVRDWEIGSFHRDHVGHETRMYDLKNYLTQLSIRLSIITPLTSFVAIEKRDKKDDLSNPLSPDVGQLLALITKDQLGSSQWKEFLPDQEGPAESMVERILRLAKTAQSNFSYASAEEYYTRAFNMAKENMSSMHNLFQSCCLEMSKFTFRVKGSAEKALQWIQPAVTPAADKDRGERVKDEKIETLRSDALNFSQILNDVIRNRLDDYMPAAPVPPGIRMDQQYESHQRASRQRLRVDLSAESEVDDSRYKTKVVAVKYSKKRTLLPSFKFSFFKSKKKSAIDRKASAPIRAPLGMRSAAVAPPRAPPSMDIEAAVPSSAPPRMKNAAPASEESLEHKLDELRDQAQTLSVELSKQAEMLDSIKLDGLASKADNLRAASSTFKVRSAMKSKKPLSSTLFGWMSRGSKRKDTREVAGRAIPTIGFSGDVEKLMKDRKGEVPASSRAEEPPVYDTPMRDTLDEESKTSDDYVGLRELKMTHRDIEVMQETCVSDDDDEYEESADELIREITGEYDDYVALDTRRQSTASLEDLQSSPHVMGRLDERRPVKPPSESDEEPTLPILYDAGRPPPPPPPPPSLREPSVPKPPGAAPPSLVPVSSPPPPPLSSTNLLTPEHPMVGDLLAQSVFPPVGLRGSMPSSSSLSLSSSSSASSSSSSSWQPKPKSKAQNVVRGFTKRRPVKPLSESDMLYDAGRAPPPPPPPKPSSLRELSVPKRPGSAPSSLVQPRPPPLSSIDLLTPEPPIVGGPPAPPVPPPLGSIRSITSHEQKPIEEAKKKMKKMKKKKKMEYIDDVYGIEVFEEHREVVLRSPIKIKESKRNWTEANRVIFLQANEGFWTWKDHRHLVDDLFVMDFEEIFQYCHKYSLYNKEDLRPIILTLLLLLFLRKVQPGLEYIDPDTSGREVNTKHETCIARAEEWLSELDTSQVSVIRGVLEENYEK